MLLTKLKLNYFGRFQNKEIELKPGINLIYGENEAGKSTVHTFIRGMLFGIERLRGRGAATKEDVYTRYLPWDYPGAYSGSMDLRIGDKDYRLQRSFHANDKNFMVLDLSTGREVKLGEGLISELLPGLSEATFKNTISIEQLKAQTDAELAAQVRNYIANLSIAKSNEVNVAKALSTLTELRKQLEPSQNMAVLKALQAEIEEGLSREEKIDQLTIQLRELLSQEQVLLRQKQAFTENMEHEDARRMDQLPAILEKYHSYQELTRQMELLQAQAKEIAEKTESGKQKLGSTETLKEDIRVARQLNSELLEWEKDGLELQKEQEKLKNSRKKNLYLCAFPTGITAVLALFVTGVQAIGILIAAILLVVGGVVCAVLGKKVRIKLQAITDKQDAIGQQLAVAQTHLSQLLQKNSVNRMEELAGKQEELLKNFYTMEHAKEQLEDVKGRINSIEDNRDLVYETIMKYLQHFLPDEELTLDTMQRLQEVIRRSKQEISGRMSEISRSCDNYRLQIEKLKWEISTLEGNEEQLLANKERYKELEQAQKENAVELEAIKLALTTIQELSADIHDSFGQQLNTTVSEAISEVTGNKYSDLKIDEKLDVKVGRSGDYVLLERLSAGTIDQVYFALRLAIADLLLGKDKVPLLLDDSFALYDEIRVTAAISQLAKRHQILLFTCHKREQRLLEDLKIPYHLIDLSC